MGGARDGMLPMPWILRGRPLPLVQLPVRPAKHKLVLTPSTRPALKHNTPPYDGLRLMLTLTRLTINYSYYDMPWILRRGPLPLVLLPVRLMNQNMNTIINIT